MLVVVLVIVYLIFGRGRMMPPWYDDDRDYYTNKTPDKALDILKQRYAKCETCLPSGRLQRRSF